MAGIKISFSPLALWISCFDELYIELLKAAPLLWSLYIEYGLFMMQHVRICPQINVKWEHVLQMYMMINTFTSLLFTVVWAFQLLFFYCPNSSPDHLLSPSCRVPIACSKANWAESASWQFIRRHPSPQKKSDSNLKTCTRVAIPEWRPSGCESWLQKNSWPT